VNQVRLIAGVDEAGRGPLAGPVVAAVAVLRDDQLLDGINDSKKLTSKKREELEVLIKQHAVDWCVGLADVAEIDQLNILGATMLAMRRAVEGLQVAPHLLRIDGNRCPELPAAYEGITETLVGGDGLCQVIGAASILAKVERDRIMRGLHVVYPQYGFDQHKGYPTAVHRQRLLEHGISPAHRRSFRPVREAAETVNTEITT
jgi:ribonuclease HII